MKHNPKNERIKRSYFVFLKEAKRQSEDSIDAVAMALTRFENYNKRRDFQSFHYEQAVGFKKFLAKQKNLKTNNPLSQATIHTTLRHLKTFFQWLCLQSGYKSRLNYSDMEYFNMAAKDSRVATAKREKPVPTIDQIRYVIDEMPNEGAIDRRNKALIAFTLLSGARDSAIASMRIKHIDFMADKVIQDAREVKTKFSKTFVSDFFPVGDDIRNIVFNWVEYLKTELMFGNDEPLFPKTNIVVGENRRFTASGVKREGWSTANPIRGIFKRAFENAGLPYYIPHSFRSTLGRFGEQVCKTPEEFKAWSQNLGHEQVMTTFTSYGSVQPQRQSEIFQKLKEPESSIGGFDDVDRLAELLATRINHSS